MTKLCYNKVAVITGASKGLGKAISEAYVENGALMIINLSRTPVLIAGVTSIQVDLSKRDQIESAVQKIKKMTNHVDILVNNAAILGSRVSILNYSPDEWEEVFKINSTAPFLLSQSLLPLMKKGSSIINVSSGLGIKGWAEWGAYSASKFALEGLSQICANELEERGIRVNVVDPGGIDTNMRAKAFPKEDRAKLANAMDRVGIFLHLASDQSIGITNQRFLASEW